MAILRCTARPAYPLLSASGWRRLLDDTCFEAIRVVQPFATSQRERDPENSVILSQVDPEICPESPSDQRDVGNWIVLRDRQGFGDALVGQLAACGATWHATRAEEHLDDDAAIELQEQAPGRLAPGRFSTASFGRFLDSVPAPSDVVFLWPLDADEASSEPEQRAEDLNYLALQVVQSLARRMRPQPRTVRQPGA